MSSILHWHDERTDTEVCYYSDHMICRLFGHMWGQYALADRQLADALAESVAQGEAGR